MLRHSIFVMGTLLSLTAAHLTKFLKQNYLNWAFEPINLTTVSYFTELTILVECCFKKETQVKPPIVLLSMMNTSVTCTMGSFNPYISKELNVLNPCFISHVQSVVATTAIVAILFEVVC